MRLLIAVAAIGAAMNAAEPAKTAGEEYRIRREKAAQLLADKQFKAARNLSLELNRQTPDDLTVYAMLAEAQIELGEFDEAEKNVDWMFRLRAPTTEGLMLGARLREQFGDNTGAIEFCDRAFGLLGPTDMKSRDRVLALAAGIEARSGLFDQASQHISVIQDPETRDSAAEALTRERVKKRGRK